jgi:hypothetical protein
VTRQDWSQGATVKVGFLTLEVLAKVATPGDGRPDLYALWNPKSGAFYQFTPHHGLSRVDDLAAALAW